MNMGEQTAEIGGCIVGLTGNCERVRFRGPAWVRTSDEPKQTLAAGTLTETGTTSRGRF